MIVEYEIVVTMGHADLEKEINTRIRTGWTPLGGVSMVKSESGDYHYVHYAQAMVREDNKPHREGRPSDGLL